MQLLRLDSDRKTAALISTLEAQLRARDERISHLETLAGGNEATVSWVVNEWSSVRERDYVQSEHFHFQDVSWFLGLFPRGSGSGNGPRRQSLWTKSAPIDDNDHVAMFLFVDLDSLPSGRSQSVEFTMRLVNHRHVQDSLKRVWRARYPVDAVHQGWGDRKVIQTLKVTEDEGFLLDDALHIEGHLVVKAMHFDLQ
jgi:hypothetical protein